MIQRIASLIISILLSVLLLIGCAQAPADPPSEGSGLNVPEKAAPQFLLPDHFSLPYDPNLTLDPITCSDGMQQVVASLLCEGLFRLTPNFIPTPWLCFSYTCTEDYTSYTFTLRDNIVFSDGSPLTGADVKAALNRARTSERYGSRLADITSVSAEGQTVTVSLASPNSSLPSLLDIPILKSGTEQGSAPIGTGPYLFSQEESSAYLVANQSWWRGSRQPLDRISLVETADQDTILYRFTSFDVQLITADLIGTTPISITGNVDYQNVSTTIFQYLGCNTTRAPLNSSAFRSALSLGINREGLCSAFLSGHAVPAQFPVSPAADLYPADLEVPHSQNEFSAALAACGYTPDRPLVLLVNSENPFKVSAAQYLAESFSAAGLFMEVQVLPWEEYSTALAAGNFDLYYGEVKLSADWDLTSLLSTVGTLNYGGWASEFTDQLLSAYAAADDPAAAMESLCAHLQKQAPILPLCFKYTSVLTQSNVLENLSSTMTEPFYNLPNCIIHLDNT